MLFTEGGARENVREPLLVVKKTFADGFPNRKYIEINRNDSCESISSCLS